MARKKDNGLCPCGSGLKLADCCGRYHAGGHCEKTGAPTAESLMRSRFAAYALGLEDYLLATWHPASRPQRLDLEDEPLQWKDLKILRCEAGQPGDSEGTVEFVARYKVNGRAGRLHETSRFVHEDGRWYYLDGTLHE